MLLLMRCIALIKPTGRFFASHRGWDDLLHRRDDGKPILRGQHRVIVTVAGLSTEIGFRGGDGRAGASHYSAITHGQKPVRRFVRVWRRWQMRRQAQPHRAGGHLADTSQIALDESLLAELRSAGTRRFDKGGDVFCEQISACTIGEGRIRMPRCIVMRECWMAAVIRSTSPVAASGWRQGISGWPTRRRCSWHWMPSPCRAAG